MNDFVPVLSDKNVTKIHEIICKNEIDAIVEYGSGASTIYFLDHFKEKNVKFISVENTKFWFYKNIKTVTTKFLCRKILLKQNYWTNSDYQEFWSDQIQPYTRIQEGKPRVERWKRVMELGPFFRFEPDSGSKLQGKLQIFRPIFKILNKFLRTLPRFANEKSTWKTNIENCTFFYELVSPEMKDQFGESPNRDAFVSAGIEHLSDDDKNVLVMIDAGPRHFIVDELIRLLSSKTLHICLFDAYRPEYDEILKKYDGQFYMGNNVLADGTEFYNEVFPNEIKRNSILAKELWYYCLKN